MNVTIQINNIEETFFDLSYSDFVKLNIHISSYKKSSALSYYWYTNVEWLVGFIQGLDIAIQNKWQRRHENAQRHWQLSCHGMHNG